MTVPKMKFRVLTIFLAVMAGAVMGCSNQRSTEQSPDSSLDSVRRPDSDIRGATVYMYTRGTLTTEIRAERIVKFESIDSTMGYVLDVDFLDSLGKVTSSLVGDSGVIRETSEHMEVYGHVVVTTHDSRRLDTDYLVWDPKINKIHTDAFVRVILPGDTVTGWGLEAPRDLSRFKILNQVSGSVSGSPR
jgi:LPS export ABC transporter protein LptC